MSQFLAQAHEAREASIALAGASRATKDRALAAMADALIANQAPILAANGLDVQLARTAGVTEALIDRLSLDAARLAAMADGLRDLAALSDPVGEVIRGWNLPNGVHIDQVRVPIGVIGIIYEARPNVTADAAGICLKSGNAVLLRGSSSAFNANQAIVAALREGLAACGIDPRAIALVAGGREVTDEMMKARGLVDLLIPRGGASLIDAVVRTSQVPVIETGTGNCHLFVDASADQSMAIDIIINAKTQRPSVCNALETLLIHRSIAETFLPRVTGALRQAGVTLHGDAAVGALDPTIALHPENGWDDEWLSLDLRLALVSDVSEAISFIRQHTSGHSETIITNDLAARQRFITEVDAACVMINTSSRFVDGGQFGFGAEIGISTQKLHARGPMALPEMTTTKYVVTGDGQVRA
ncbi:MAG: glutamate-5-semialdehyde dehydrogenase [Propionibacteriaceae bacterium]|jgi:glutamate-5-semialdehyde dehydrogenase|nr:glutamate-5-semialdehyde dehydrogenase [Propionibacteriaceae bacterium]